MGLCRNAVAQKLRSGFEPGKRLGNRIVELYKMRPTVLHTKRQELSHFDILWIFSCNELCTHKTYHHDPQPLPVNSLPSHDVT